MSYCQDCADSEKRIEALEKQLADAKATIELQKKTMDEECDALKDEMVYEKERRNGYQLKIINLEAELEDALRHAAY